MTKHVAVLMGGWSAEREVSLRSGKACADALARLGYRVTPIDVGRDIATVLAAVKPDVALNVLHGRPGEDGTLQGLLGNSRHSLHAIPACWPPRSPCARITPRRCSAPPACRWRRIWWRRGSRRRKAISCRRPTWSSRSRRARASASSSSPRSIAHPPQELYRDDWPFGEKVLIERYIPGKELTCAVLGDRALDVIEIVPATRFYDYEAKYAAGGSKHLLPAPILPNVYQEVRRLALAAHSALGCRGVSRADFRYDDRGTGKLVCLEVNTQPGMTETSLVPELAAYAGITFDELVRWMVEDASTNR